MRTHPNAIVSLGLLCVCGSLLAETNSVHGTVIGTDGKPLAGAVVRAERLDAKAAPVLTSTDAKGQYVLKGLPAGAYSVIAIVKNVPKSRAAVRTRSDGWARVDFDLRKGANVSNSSNSADA